METTAIAPERTVSEIQQILMQYGATAILIESAGGKITAVSFKHLVNDQEIPFRLPCRWEAVADVLRKRAKISDWAWKEPGDWYRKRRVLIEDKARRVAWRQILRWVQAQMALVSTNMVKIEEVFFPYIQAPGGKTLFEAHEEKHFALLESGK